MDNFFYNLNKKMADLAHRQDLAESAVTERDMGKHNNATTGFKALAKKAGAKYGSKAAGERVAGAQFQKMKKAGQLQEIGDTPAGKAALGSYIKKAHASGDAARSSSSVAPMGSKDETQGRQIVQKRAGGIGQAVDRLTKENSEGHCSSCDCSPCECDSLEEVFGPLGVHLAAKFPDTADKLGLGLSSQSSFGLDDGSKPYPVREADPMGMEEGAFKNVDATMQQPRHRVGRGELNQVPGVQNIKPRTKENPLKNVAKGIKAFVKGEPEPMDEVKSKKSAKPDYIDLDGDGNRKESMKKAAADKKRSTGTAFDPDTHKRMKTDQEGTGNFDKKKISTGTVYTRRHKEDDEDEIKSDQPKVKGRPKGPAKGPERVTSKAWKHKGGRAVKENDIAITDRGEYDDEVGMAKDQIHTIVRHATELERALGAGDNLPEWVQEKMGQIKGMMTSVTDYMLSQKERGIETDRGQEGIRIAEDVTMSTGAIQELWKLATFLKGYIRDPEGMAAWQEMAQLIKGYKDSQQQNVAEKAVSKSQRKFMGMAHAIQKGEKIKGASPALKKVAKTMKTGDTHDFAVTKEKGLPKKVKKTDEGNDGNLANNAKPYDKVTKGDVIAGRLGKDEMGGKKPKEKKVAETTTSGSVASAPAKATTNAGGMTFGKGVYEGAVNESYERKLKAVLNEGMNVTVNMNAEGQKSVNVSADGEDAEKLAEILKLAGLGGQSGGCSSGGQSSCGCETVDEAYGDTTASKNNPDWPTDTETTDANDPYLRRFSGGLNGPKSTGQTTVPVVASQARRQVSMEENVKLERSLFNTWKTYKGQ